MPRVSRNYARKDYSYLLNKLQNQRQESPVQPQPRISDCKVAPSVPVISPEARRRASLCKQSRKISQNSPESIPLLASPEGTIRHKVYQSCVVSL